MVYEHFDAKNLEFFNGMLLHTSVAMKTYFGQLASYLENLARAKHSNLILFHSQYTYYFLLSDNIINLYV